ncbi:MAG: hypothetical protein ACM3ZA_00995 [Bacillota bacterium]
MAFPTFNENSTCPKCGATNAATKFCGGNSSPDHLPGCAVEGEHLHRFCARCGAERIELPLDAGV